MFIRKVVAAAGLALALASTSAYAEKGGCLKYGAAGAAGGHMVGSGHAVAGAVAGCAVGTHERHKAEKQQEQNKDTAPKNPQG
jgi:hypothetical protein